MLGLIRFLQGELEMFHTRNYGLIVLKHVPIGRMANVKEIMNAVIYLIDDDSSYSIGSNLVVDGGWTSW